MRGIWQKLGAVRCWLSCKCRVVGNAFLPTTTIINEWWANDKAVCPTLLDLTEIKMAENKKNRITEIRGLIIAIILSIGGFFYLIYPLFSTLNNPSASPFAKAIAEIFVLLFPKIIAMLVIAGAFSYLSAYLDKTKKQERKIEEINDLGEFKSVFGGFKSEHELIISSSGINEQQKNDLLDLLKQQLTTIAAGDLITELKTQVASATQTQDIAKIYLQASERLSNEIDALNRRGQLSLVIGIITTGIVFCGMQNCGMVNQRKNFGLFLVTIFHV